MRGFVVLLCLLVLSKAIPSQRPSEGTPVEPSYQRHHPQMSRIEGIRSGYLLQVQTESGNVTIPGSIEIPCPRGCLVHGSCDYSNGTCICNAGYHGSACSIAYKCDYNCHNHGVCVADQRCVCAVGFGGVTCEEDRRCPANCSGHGRCNALGTECHCDAGWLGEICSRQAVEAAAPRQWTKLFPPDSIDPSQAGSRPLGRHGHSLAPNGDIAGQQVLMWGGKAGKEPLDEMWLYDTPSRQWSRKFQTGIRPGPRYSHAAASDSMHMYVFGGFEPCGDTGQYSGELWRWSFDEELWTHLPVLLDTGLTDGPVGRAGHSLVRVGETLFVFGGLAKGEISLQDTWAFSIASGKWAKRSPSNFGSRRFHSAIVDSGDSFVVFGGMDADGTPFNTMHRYVVSKDAWSTIAVADKATPSPRFSQVALFHNGRLVLAGGRKSEQSGHIADMWAVDLTADGAAWKQLSVKGDLTGVSSSAGIVVGGFAVVVAGLTDAGDSGDVWRVDLDTALWTEEATLGDLPERRMLHSANVIAGKLWIFGGQSPASRVLRDLWAFDLTSHAWTFFAPSAVASADSASAYSCGSVAEASAGVVTSEAGVKWPPARNAHASTVLHGADSACGDVDTLLVFGGINAEGHVTNDLWYWCAGVQQWAEVPVPAEQPRTLPPRSHAGVANIGSTIYVFGGMTEDRIRLNDLWTCQLTSGACQPVYTQGAQTPHTRRSMNVLVDTHVAHNPQLVVFGGYWKESNACSACATVVRAMDIDRYIDVWKFEAQYTRWRKVYANDAPEQRYCAESFITGNRMFMFGGYAVDGILEHNDLWYFNLDAQQWRRLPAADGEPAPSGRHEHTFDLWTTDAAGPKTYAVVYGGIGASGLLHDIWAVEITDALTTDDFTTSAAPKHRAAHMRHVVA